MHFNFLVQIQILVQKKSLFTPLSTLDQIVVVFFTLGLYERKCTLLLPVGTNKVRCMYDVREKE